MVSMRSPRRAAVWLVALLLGLGGASRAYALDASIFVTGHDPLWHAGNGGNTVGATNLAQTGIEYARNGDTRPFLFIESKTAPIPSGNTQTAPFLTSVLGYAPADFVHMDAADLAALPDFALALESYSAIVVTSDHGGMLTGAELSFLNGHGGDILRYLEAGGGLYAEAESNATGNIGATSRFGFLPFLVSSTDFQSSEVANTVTPLGTSLGLVGSDVNGNFSHNFFSSAAVMSPVDLFNGDPSMPLSLAFRGPLVQVPEPGTMVLIGAGICWIGATRRRKA